TSGAACRPWAYPWTACCLSDVPASGVPVAVFVRASAVADRVSVRVAEAAAVVSVRLAACEHRQQFSAEPSVALGLAFARCAGAPDPAFAGAGPVAADVSGRAAG